MFKDLVRCPDCGTVYVNVGLSHEASCPECDSQNWDERDVLDPDGEYDQESDDDVYEASQMSDEDDDDDDDDDDE